MCEGETLTFTSSSTEEWIKAWRESDRKGKEFNKKEIEASVESLAISSTTDKSLNTSDKLLNISKTVIREKYEKSSLPDDITVKSNGSGTAESFLPSLDRRDEQLRPIETKPPISKQSLKQGFKKKHLFGDHLEKTKRYFETEWPSLLEECDNWQDAMERCYIALQNKKSSDKKGIITQCQTRFSKGYKKEMAWRMQQFSEKMQRGGFRQCLQITLSTDPKKFKNLDEVGEAWKRCLESFMDFMNKRLRDAGKKHASFYLRACELTESGLLHVHIGLYGAGLTGKIEQQKYNRKTRTYDTFKDYIFPQKDINDLWKKYGLITGDHNIGTWVNRAPVNEVSDYITKHVAKSWGGESNDMLEAFLHYTNMRQWSSSRGAVPQLPESIESWELREMAYNPGKAVQVRTQMLKEEIKIISDDSIEWERRLSL